MVSFEDIYHFSTLIDENEFYKHYYNEHAKFKYDSNYFELKLQPNLEEFQIIEGIHIAFAEKAGLEHIKFYWPENSPLTLEIIQYFEEIGFQLELLELYTVDPSNFSPTRSNPHVTVEKVTQETLAEFKEANYQQDLPIGLGFADKKQDFYEQLYYKPFIEFYLAKIGNETAGGLILIESENYLEIDSLFTDQPFRNLGTATELQRHIMNQASVKNKQVILVADGEDTPREMYQKQGYRYISYRLGAQYIFGARKGCLFNTFFTS